MALSFIRHPRTLGVMYIPVCYCGISNKYISEQSTYSSTLSKQNLSVENGPPVSVMVPMITRQCQEPVLHALRIQTAIFGMYLFHFLPLLALGLAFFDTQFLKVDISTVKHTRRIAVQCSLLAAESR